VLWAVKHFRYYILGRKCTVFTDCVALPAIFHTPKSSHELYKEAVLLQQYDIVVKYIKGEHNGCADVLSRLVLPDEVPSIEDDVAAVPLFIIHDPHSVLSRQLFTETHDEIKEAQSSCRQSRDLYRYLDEDILPDEPARIRSTLAKASKFTIEQSLLCRRGSRGWLLPVIPLSYHQVLVSRAHQFLGHFGAAKVYEFLRNKAWWIGMRSDIRIILSSCEICAKENNGPRIEPPLSQVLLHRPFERLEVDIVSLQPSKNKYQYILMFIDCFTKWVEAIPYKKMPTAQQVTAALKEHIIARFGCPQTVHSDRGSNLVESKLLIHASETFGFKVSSGFSHIARSQGTVERCNGTITRLLVKLMRTFNTNNWDELLPAALLAYRSTIHRSAGQTPFFLIYGRDIDLPFGLHSRDCFAPPLESPEWELYAVELARRMQTIWGTASQMLQHTQLINKQAFMKRRMKMPNIKLGDTVLLFHPQNRRKGLTETRTGPYAITTLTETGAVLQPSWCRPHDPLLESSDSGECASCHVRYFVGLHRLKLWRQPARPSPQESATHRRVVSLSVEVGGRTTEIPTHSVLGMSCYPSEHTEHSQMFYNFTAESGTTRFVQGQAAPQQDQQDKTTMTTTAPLRHHDQGANVKHLGRRRQSPSKRIPMMRDKSLSPRLSFCPSLPCPHVSSNRPASFVRRSALGPFRGSCAETTGTLNPVASIPSKGGCRAQIPTSESSLTYCNIPMLLD
jgi:hypothetical protein